MATELKTGALRPSKAPNLPIAPVDYSQQFMDQYSNALRLYFNEIDNFAQPFSSNTGGQYLRFPNGSFYSTSTQNATSNTTTYKITIDTTVTTNQVSLSNNGTITFAIAGYYNLQFSAQLTNSNTGSPDDACIWIKRNSSNVAFSGSLVTVPPSHGGTKGKTIMAANFVDAFNAGDTVEFWWSAGSAGLAVETVPAGGTFGSPVSPSIIVTATFVSALYT